MCGHRGPITRERVWFISRARSAPEAITSRPIPISSLPAARFPKAEEAACRWEPVAEVVDAAEQHAAQRRRLLHPVSIRTLPAFLRLAARRPKRARRPNAELHQQLQRRLLSVLLR